jgi:hypothetical protein
MKKFVRTGIAAVMAVAATAVFGLSSGEARDMKQPSYKAPSVTGVIKTSSGNIATGCFGKATQVLEGKTSLKINAPRNGNVTGVIDSQRFNQFEGRTRTLFQKNTGFDKLNIR